MKNTKYRYLKVLQGCYDGKTWDDLVAADTRSLEECQEFKADKKAYAENEPQYRHRVIFRREPNPDYKAI